MNQLARKLFTSQPSLVLSIVSFFDSLPPWFFRRGSQFAVDALVCAISVYAVFLIRFDFNIPPQYRVVMWLWVALLPPFRIFSLWGFGIYDGIWRYFEANDAIELAFAALPASALMFVLRIGFGARNYLSAVPIGVIVLEFGVFLLMACGVRILRRTTHEMARSTGSSRRKALLLGTDDTLNGALRHISMYGDVQVVGMLAPEVKLHGLRIGGYPVLGDPSLLPQLLTEQKATLILVAEANMPCLAEVISLAVDFNVDVRLLPSAANVLMGDVRVNAPVKPENAFAHVASSQPDSVVTEMFRERVVIITGAGGSIGSELSRQVAKLPVKKILLLDQDENAIFEIHNELMRAGGPAGLFPLIGDIRDRKRLNHIFAMHRPHIVLHAAAYKHVPMMEVNCSEAVLNNIVGTKELAEAAIEYSVERFVMISSDKAVNPTSVMGATKRVAEVVVQEQAAVKSVNCSTRFSCVRFGNVAGSRGSVIPIFLRQIAAGEALTITDEQMTRYFMTIPEAVQLVLQASTLGSEGDIYMLDMGDPVKITDLAKKLITMSGLTPYKDVAVKFVGIRTGEKIHEQLWQHGSSVVQTPFSRVFKIQAEAVPNGFQGLVEDLRALAIAHQDKEVFDALCSMPINFSHENAIKTVHA